MNLASFVKTPKQGHPVLDFQQLVEKLPNQKLDIWNISSPADLIGWELARKKHGITQKPGTPCDLFLWAKGTPPDPRLTHIGGVPFLPLSHEWPTSEEGPMQFLCQFDFRDSLDLPDLPSLPGDILLIFIKDEFSPFTDDPNDTRCIWVSADENNIISKANCPTIQEPFEFLQAWGIRHRSNDFPSTWKLAYQIEDPSISGRPWSLPILWCSKIGGVPYDSQENHDHVPSGFLCQLCSVQPASETSWPWVNQETALTMDSDESSIYHESNTLMIGDLGEVSFFINKDGSVSTQASCG